MQHLALCFLKYSLHSRVRASSASLLVLSGPVPQVRLATAVNIDALVLFSLIWTVGATGDTDGRAAFDAYFR